MGWNVGNGALRNALSFLILMSAGFNVAVFAQNPAPAISSISPASGPMSGGTAVTITGANFQTGATVNLGSAAATNVTVVNSTTITATTPANAGGAVNVVVTNPDAQTGTLYAVQQPLTNPGFESGNTGWVALPLSAATVITNPSGAHSGSNYAQLAASKPASFVAVLNGTSQYLPVNPGDVINFGGWAFRADTNAGDGNGRWQIEVTDINKANPIYITPSPGNVTTASWVQQQGTYTVATGKSFVRLMCQIAANTALAQVNFDDAILSRTIPGGGFTYLAPPSLTSVSPASGSASGGTAVTLTGSGFQTGATVTFGTTAASNVTVLNGTTITATTPASGAGPVNVKVTNPDNQSSTLNNGFTFGNPAPAISSISPASGPMSGGTAVTITGANFQTGATVNLGSAAATNVTVVNSTTITATTPANAGGAVNVVVTNPDSQTGTLYAVQQPLTNPGFESGNTGWVALPLGAATVITNPSGAHSGSNYAQLAASKPASFVAVLKGTSQYLPVNPGDVINFGGWAFRGDTNAGDGNGRWQIEVTDINKANPIYITPSPGNVTTASWVQQQGTYTVATGKSFVRLMCQIAANTALAQVNFDDAILSRTIAGGGFTYLPPPTLASISPSAGALNGGTLVTLSGLNFLSGATVVFGTTAASNVTVVSSTTITATTPANPQGAVNVVVTNPDGQHGGLILGYTYNPAPTITSVAPSSGTTAGGTSTTIGGTNFLNGATVSFGGVAATSVTVVKATQIAATTPGHTAGAVNVVVTNPDQQVATATNGFTFLNAAPVITSIAPSSGTSNGGTSVSIHGFSFQTGATATLGGSPLTIVAVSHTLIQGTTTAHVAGGVDVVVTNPDTQTSTLAAMLYNQGFESGSTRWVSNGKGSATIVNNTNNAHNGTFYAEINAPSGKQTSLFVADDSGNPLYFPVSPGQVITFGGWAYRVSGDGLARWDIEVSDINKANPTFTAAPPSNIQDAQWELQQGTYTVPSGGAFLRLLCQITGNTVTSVARFDDAILQISPGGTNGYTYLSPPMATSIAPNWGAPAGGTSRTLSGTGFQTGATVTVGGVAGTNVVVNSSNAITFAVPPNSTGTYDVVVTGPDLQSSTLPASYTYRLVAAPPAGMTAIQHIIFMLQENRSFDQYFGVMNQYRANNGVNDNAVDGLPLNVALPDIAGQMIPPFHLQTECEENTQPSWNASHIDYDNGLMDNFMKTGNLFPISSTIDPNGTRAVGYYDWTDLPYYYSLAFTFATSDRWFSSLMGPTGANRAYSFAATSVGFIGTPVSPTGGLPNFTIFDLLDQAGVSWRYYYQGSSPAWLPMWSVYFKDTAKAVPISNYYTDVNNPSTFPQVVFIEENGNTDEHPKPNPGTNGTSESIQTGANLMSGIIGALMGSPTWTSSVFVLSYDEAGGLHDHVPPPAAAIPDGYRPLTRPGTDQPGIFNQFGMRVPLMVVSPWTGPNMVSHIVRDHTSILKLIETRFSLPPLTSRDAAADNMSEFFNFTSPPYMTPPTLATQPTNGVCNLNLEKAPGQ